MLQMNYTKTKEKLKVHTTLKIHQESHLLAKQKAMNITQRASMLYAVLSAKSCCFLVRQMEREE